MLLTILWFLLAIIILVTVHEWGHFYVARRCGVKVLRFSVGFGKSLYSWRDKLGTEYTLAAIPLGGYVKMLDERDGDVAVDERPFAFTQKTVWQRIAIVSAGPAANFLLAIILYFVIALMGSSGIAPILGELESESIAAQAGLKAGDEIIAVDGTQVQTWSQVFTRLMRRVGDTGTIQLDIKLKDSTLVEPVFLPIKDWLYEAEKPNFLESLGLKAYNIDRLIIRQVIPGGPAEKAGLRSGDRVLTADQQLLSSWREWVKYVQLRPNKPIELQIDRQGEPLQILLTPEALGSGSAAVGRVGVSPWPNNMVRTVEYTVWQSVKRGVVSTWAQIKLIFLLLKKLLVAEVSFKNLGGTLTIAQAAGESAAAGLISYLGLLAFFSVNLGVINLLPIPVLDGGHILYYLIEWIKGSPVPEKVQLIGYQVGLFLILGVMIVAHVNDFLRILS